MSMLIAFSYRYSGIALSFLPFQEGLQSAVKVLTALKFMLFAVLILSVANEPVVFTAQAVFGQ